MIAQFLLFGWVMCSVAALPLETEPAKSVPNAVDSQVNSLNTGRQDEDDDPAEGVDFSTSQPLITEIIDLAIAGGMKLLNITTPAPPPPPTPQTVVLNNAQLNQLGLGQFASPVVPQPGQLQPAAIIPQLPQQPQPPQQQVIYVTVATTVEPETPGSTDEDDDDDN